jgi:hypothetical protein
VNDELDAELTLATCDAETSSSPIHFHDRYRCGSLNHQIRMVTEFARSVLGQVALPGIDRSNLTGHVNHIIAAHAMGKLQTVSALLVDLLDVAASHYRQTATILFVCGILISLCSAILVFIYKSTIDQTYQGALICLRRCSPAGIVANEPLLNYLLNRKVERQVSLSTTASIIYNARDAIVCIPSSGMID